MLCVQADLDCQAAQALGTFRFLREAALVAVSCETVADAPVNSNVFN